MRKLNQRRTRAIPCTIPRPPTPPTSVQVQTLNKKVVTNKTSLSTMSPPSSSNSSRASIMMTGKVAPNDPNVSCSLQTCTTNSIPVINSHPHHHLHQQQQQHNRLQHHHHNQRLGQHHHQLPKLHPREPRENSHPSSTLSSSASFMKESSGESDTASSSSQDANEPGDAIEPNEEFPAPPEDFLEDIKAFRKQEEIEGPLESSANPSGQKRDVTDLVLSAALNRLHESLPNNMSRPFNGSFNGNGSLNSSITETETTESSWSPSTSPISSSPLPSPCPSSSSTQSFSVPDGSQRFLFPPGHPLTSSPSHRHSLRGPPPSHVPGHLSHRRLLPSHPSSARNQTTGVRGVTLAPLHPASLERESIYQRIPPTSHSYGSLPRLPSNSTSSSLRPPDYLTAMQRLSVSKVSTSKLPPASTHSSSVTQLTSSTQSIPIHQQVRSQQPLKSIPLSSSLPEKSSLPLPSVSEDEVIKPPPRLRRTSVSSSCSDESRVMPGQGLKKTSLKIRKRVSFSDKVELVAHSEDMEEEEHLPNPLLDRVLGKAFLQNNQIRNGSS